MKPIRYLAVLAAVASTLAPAVAEAHGIWFAERARQVGLIYGVGADDLDMVKRLPLIQSVTGYDEAGKPVDVSLRADGALAVVDTKNDPAVVAATMFNGMWTKERSGQWHKNKGRDEFPDAVVAEKTYKYTVHIRRNNLTAPLAPLPGHTLQIVPVEAKLPEQMGQPIKLRVLVNGKPAGGAKVLVDFVNDPDAEPLLTAADGSITVKVRNQGLNVIQAVVKTAPDEPKKIDTIEHTATLSFVLPHLPE